MEREHADPAVWGLPGDYADAAWDSGCDGVPPEFRDLLRRMRGSALRLPEGCLHRHDREQVRHPEGNNRKRKNPDGNRTDQDPQAEGIMAVPYGGPSEPEPGKGIAVHRSGNDRDNHRRKGQCRHRGDVRNGSDDGKPGITAVPGLLGCGDRGRVPQGSFIRNHIYTVREGAEPSCRAP